MFFEFFAAIDASPSRSRAGVEIKRGRKRINFPIEHTFSIPRRMQLSSHSQIPVSVFTARAVFQSVHQIIAQDNAVAETTSRIARIHAALILIRGCVARIEASLILALTDGQIVDFELLRNARIARRWLMVCTGRQVGAGVKSSPLIVLIETSLAVISIPLGLD